MLHTDLEGENAHYPYTVVQVSKVVCYFSFCGTKELLSAGAPICEVYCTIHASCTVTQSTSIIKYPFIIIIRFQSCQGITFLLYSLYLGLGLEIIEPLLTITQPRGQIDSTI
jgi:hypothetical protein